ncbi:conserved hypothetical protein [Histoplasma mississippiense (nom. inval.)]|uniref:conserved hypothetical protein n=1 Tax=Ajellomyces capsulatus (strain NAm1 / WU24) TaxID=2059318 RepID=UPI000157B852|nr:conserved hypothetical protein [Histoplasma mississippiense (nom. inval.)]EDN03939.1 conserved hypothetical protein [Histoplasma mississippiense (nom. inval.)]
MATKRSRATFEYEHFHAPYAIYGTPLPPLDPEVRDDDSYIPVWKQEVRDDQGRKRLHGAFTGGFSAGYFNTVGSKEGWTPSTFVSSRRNRAKDAKQQTPQQRPEDFMDEEDLLEAENARRLQTAGDYTGFGSTAADTTRLGGFMDLFKTAGDTIGVKLLKRMGWKEGQGIGPKVRRKADLGDAADEQCGVHFFAPANLPTIMFLKKSDYKGLGYEGEARLNSKQPRRGGFGVGVLNDTGSDDDDPYEMGPQISYNRFIDYDKKAKKITSNNSSSMKPSMGLSNPLLGSTKPVFISKKKAAVEKTKAGFRKCHDGRLPLDGFLHGINIACSTISSHEKKYAAPEIPKDWKPTKEPSRPGPIQNYMSHAETAKTSSLDPTSRAALLGEDQLPGKSVFDYMTPAGREKIAKATGRTDLPSALGEKGPESFETREAPNQKDLWNLVPKLDKDLATQALNRGICGWMPYAEDEAKRSRYRSFLEVRAGLRDKLPDRAPDASTDNWVIELQEFARAAEVFKPMSGLMASRSLLQFFDVSEHTTSKQKEQIMPNMRPSFADQIQNLKIPPKQLRKSASNISFDTGDIPGGHGYGAPSRSPTAPSGSKLDILSKEAVNRILMGAGAVEAIGSAGIVGAEGEQQQQQQQQLEQQHLKKEDVFVDPGRNEALEAARPGDAVFKAIFGSDDQNDEDDDEGID